jgi:hypothetical protein
MKALAGRRRRSNRCGPSSLITLLTTSPTASAASARTAIEVTKKQQDVPMLANSIIATADGHDR